MISAEGFARQNGVWHRSTPTLENYMRWVNKNLYPIPGGGPVASSSAPSRNSLISEAAYLSVFRDAPAAIGEARSLVTRLPRGEEAFAVLVPSELSEVALIRDNLEAFIRVTKGHHEPEFQPYFEGCGVVEPAHGDILIGDELIEVKAVQRPFRSLDVRQLLTYAALAYAGDRAIRRLTLLNPRRSWRFSVVSDELALDIGAASWVELMKDLIDAMSGQEVSL